ncbi:hypothetical protein JG688_00003005 [Phytophthora aleatoria]|uniref:Uncharacterized protein n=1 Tax=Phytophthora aleatoria TaxID=2496075 RepID=A0A8J5J2B2_9STRA|nr:hypothetical protein JG688_00003005 [Phytophthora aleatoria]
MGLLKWSNSSPNGQTQAPSAPHYPATIDGSIKKIRVPLPNDAALGLFGHIYRAAHTCDLEDKHANGAPSTLLSSSCVWTYRSALVDVYRANKARSRLATRPRIAPRHRQLRKGNHQLEEARAQ